MRSICCVIVLTCFHCVVVAGAKLQRDEVLGAQKLPGLHFTPEQIDMMLPGLEEQLRGYEVIRRFPLSNGIPPAIQFNPIPAGYKIDSIKKGFKMSPVGKVKLPANLDDLAFYSISELSALIKGRQISSEKLTKFFLERFRKYGAKLECAVTLTEETALRQARHADKEMVFGKYRGPLHGIPYGAKDLLATRGTPTTWGAAPYTNQCFDFDATVIQRLEAAGAVLIAKTTLGELAMGEHWFGGITRNPWNIKQGSSGSSAGSCAATAAGLIPFGIGSETLGSIVSPCDRCGTTGLRPSFGRVSRAGAMTLSWTMDKLGPICRSAEDCAIVFNAIYGPDGVDPTVCDASFNYEPRINLRKLRIGYLKGDFEKETGERKENDQAALNTVREMAGELVSIELPDYAAGDLMFILSTEASAAFDDLTLSGRDALLKQQARGSWPDLFRKSRFVPAVEYIQAQRIRYLLIQDMARIFEKVDLFLAPSFAGKNLLISNLAGLPCVVLPAGFTKSGTPTSICFIGNLFKEAPLLAVAKKFQDATLFQRQHPNLEKEKN